MINTYNNNASQEFETYDDYKAFLCSTLESHLGEIRELFTTLSKINVIIKTNLFLPNESPVDFYLEGNTLLLKEDVISSLHKDFLLNCKNKYPEYYKKFHLENNEIANCKQIKLLFNNCANKFTKSYNKFYLSMMDGKKESESSNNASFLSADDTILSISHLHVQQHNKKDKNDDFF